MARRVLLLLVSGALAALVLELGVRWLAPQSRSIWIEDRMGLALHWPGLDRTFKPFGTRVQTNRFGMRDREHELTKPAGTLRVLVLGDSFIEALQVPYEQAFPSLLEAGLARALHQPVEVISGAVSGWGTEDQLDYFERYGRDFSPDLVVVAFTLHNDVNDNLHLKFHSGDRDRLRPIARAQTPTASFWLARAKGFIASLSEAYMLALKARRRSDHGAASQVLEDHVTALLTRGMDERVRLGWKWTYRLLDALDRSVRESGARLAIVAIPLSLQLSEPDADQLLRGAGFDPSRTWLEQPQHRLQDWSTRANVPLIDLLSAFRQRHAERGSALYISGDGHWDAEGHALAAAVASEGLIESGLLTASDASRRSPLPN